MDETGAEVEIEHRDLFAAHGRDRETVGGVTCCVPGCYNNTYEDAKKIKFHKFPQDASQCRLWRSRIGRPSDWRPKAHTRICGNHFVGHRKSKAHPDPAVFPLRDEKRYYPRKSRRPIIRSTSSSTPVQDNVPVADHSSSVPNANADVDFECELDVTEQPEVSLQEEVERLKAENNLLRRSQFSLERFKHDKRGFRYYTGLPNYAVFKVMYDTLFKPCLTKLFYYRTGESGVSAGRRVSFHRRALDPELECFVFLSILRRGFQQLDLAYRLNVSQPSISRIFTTWLQLAHDQLVQVPIWLSQSSVRERMPEWFREHFPRTRVILDCTEFFIEMPSSFRAQSETYSSYKHHNTAKALIAIAPHGAIMFASPLYGGKQSDKAIVRHCGILDLLEPGDQVMADRGFEISSILPPDVSLVIPSFMDGRPQLPYQEEKLSRQIASARIHVERAICRVKTFRILSHLFPLKMKASLDLIWQVCARLCNFLPPLIASCGPASTTASVTSEDQDLVADDIRNRDEFEYSQMHVTSPVDDECAYDSVMSPFQPSNDSPMRGLSPSDPAFVPSPPTCPIILTQPEGDAVLPCTVLTQPTSATVHVPVLSHAWPCNATPRIITEHLLPFDYCQSRIDGRNGSNACTVIAALSAAAVVSGSIRIPLSSHQPQSESVAQFIKAMRNGNAVYEQTFPCSHPLLGVYDAFTMLGDVSCRRDGDFGIRTAEHFQLQLHRVYEICQKEQCVLAGVLVQTPLSVAVGISHTGHAVILDSHGHGSSGGLMAFLHQPADWASLVTYLETLIGKPNDAHLCLVAVTAA